MASNTRGEIQWPECAPLVFTRRRVKVRAERSSRAWQHVAVREWSVAGGLTVDG